MRQRAVGTPYSMQERQQLCVIGNEVRCGLSAGHRRTLKDERTTVPCQTWQVRDHTKHPSLRIVPHRLPLGRFGMLWTAVENRI